jgi:serine/threonine protein kinase
MPRWNADCSLQGHYLYAPLRIYTFQIRIRRHERSHTTNDRSEDQLPRSILEERVRRRYVLRHRQNRFHLSDFEPRHPTAKSFIRALLNSDPARRPTAEQALAHAWLTSFAAPTEHDLSGLRENFDPRARWRSAISTARALSRFAHYKGANHLNDRLTISTDEEDDNGGGSTSWRATPGSNTKRQSQPQPQQQQQQQQHLSPPSPDDRAPRRGLAGLAAAGTSRSSTSSPMSFSEAINKAKASAEAEKKADAPRAQTNPAAFEPRKTEEEEEEEDEEEEVELRIPGSFSFENVGGGAARGAGGAGTDDPFDAVGMLGNLWRRMQMR